MNAPVRGKQGASPSGAGRRSRQGFALAAAFAAVLGLPWAVPAAAVPLTADELASVCAGAEGTAHCSRTVEALQIKRLPNLATRDGPTLKVQLYPAGVATFTDTEALNGGRSYSLWDYLDAINAVVLYTTDGDAVSFTLLQRASGRKVELPNEPRVSPDRQRLLTADFCAAQCVNELAVWRVTREGIVKEAAWKPREAWSDAGATWRDADTIVVEYTPAGGAAPGTLVRRLNDPGWQRLSPP
jgi:hypothetical protein